MKIILFFFVLFTCSQCIFSQDTIASSGGDNTGSGGSSSYTIGQLIYTSNFENNTIIAQGVQQAFEFQSINNAKPTSANYKILTYPNPTVDYILVELPENVLSNLNFKLFDIKGQQITNGQITNSKTQINIQQLANGLYFLQVLQHQALLKTFQIIKK